MTKQTTTPDIICVAPKGSINVLTNPGRVHLDNGDPVPSNLAQRARRDGWGFPADSKEGKAALKARAEADKARAEAEAKAKAEAEAIAAADAAEGPAA